MKHLAITVLSAIIVWEVAVAARWALGYQLGSWEIAALIGAFIGYLGGGILCVFKEPLWLLEIQERSAALANTRSKNFWLNLVGLCGVSIYLAVALSFWDDATAGFALGAALAGWGVAELLIRSVEAKALKERHRIEPFPLPGGPPCRGSRRVGP